MVKKAIVSLAVGVMVLSAPISTFAKDSLIDYLNDEEVLLSTLNDDELNTDVANTLEMQSFRVGEASIFVNVLPGVEISEECIMRIINNNDLEDGELITIHSVGYFSDYNPNLYNNVDNYNEARILYTHNTVQIGFGRQRTMDDVFITSVARGQTITLSRQFSRTVGVNISSGKTPWIFEGNLSRSVTSTVTTTEQFQGPPNNGPYNTREFRIEFIGTPGTFRQTRTNRLTGNSQTITFSADIPSHYVRYSLDRRW